MGEEEQTKAPHLTEKWIILPLVAAMLFVSLVLVVLLYATCLAEQKGKILLESSRASLYGRVNDQFSILQHMNKIVFSLANAIKLTERCSFSEVEMMIAPRLFTLFSITKVVSHVSYIGKNGLVFAYHRDNRTNAILSVGSHSCHFYKQTVDQYSAQRYGYPVALSYQHCLATKGFFQDLLNGQVGSAKINNQTIFFTAPVENFGVVSVGVDLRDFLEQVSEIGFDLLFITINHSSGSQTPIPSSQAAYSLNDTDSIYLVGSNTEFHEHLSSTQNSSILIKIPNVPMVITLTFPDNKTMKIFQVLKIVIICSAGVILICMTLLTFFMLGRLKRSKIQEAILKANLIKQKEAVQQAERKSMNKSMAFARASHDVRNPLHSIIALIELCKEQTTPSFEMETNLMNMNDYAKDLLGILNTILDTSKVESGKMHLEQVDFNIADAIEESVDAFNILAEKKRLEMIWDPCDFSILKLGNVMGDKKRFKQILGNLLSNAVKFTSEGKIVVRAYTSKPKMKILNFSSDYGCSISQMFFCISRSVLQHCGSKIKQQAVDFVQNDPHSIELIFEVDDSGIGIPAEKKASVFENYIQVKEDSPEGTGLGLGIVQSFVRLMGGEISIQDKLPGEKGTCFKFNIYLKSGEVAFQNTSRHREADQSTSSEPLMLDDSHSRKLHSLLFVQGYETKRILQTWIESIGIKVWTANQAEHISPTLEKIKNNINYSAKSDSVLLCKSFSWKTESVENMGFMRSKENSESLPKAELCNELPLRILIIVDLSDGNSMEILSTLIEFCKRNINLYCKIICIANSKVSEKDLNKFRALPCDLTLRKPIHGSQLKKLFKFIQELEETEELYGDRVTTSQLVKPQTAKRPEKSCEIIEETSSKAQDENFLRGQRVLLVDDHDILRLMGSKLLSTLGAEVEVANDGLEALNLVKKALETRLTREKCSDYSSVYDAIFMDCQMLVMDGYEAARQIRKEEGKYGIHMPIIALSADKRGEEIRKALAAGMDHFLEKPLTREKVVDLFKPAG